MLQPIIQTPDLTLLGRPLSEYREILTERKPAPATIETSFYENLGYTSEKVPQHTELDYIGKADIKATKPVRRFSISTRYSKSYVDFNRKLMLGKLSVEIAEWLVKGTDRAVPHIVNIKRLLEEHVGYLEQFSDTRLLLGALELIFENNEWENMPEQKLRFFKTKIDYMANNELDFRQIQNFLKELHTSKIRVLKPGYGYGEKEEKAKKSV